MTVTEILNQSIEGAHVKTEGWITIGRTNRLYASQEDAESESLSHLQIANAEDVRDSLFKSVPAFVGGDHVYHDEASVEGTVDTSEAHPEIRLICVTVQRDQQSFKQRIAEQE